MKLNNVLRYLLPTCLILLLGGCANSDNNQDTVEARVQDILEHMTLTEKIGQMIQPEIKYVTPADVQQYALGSVLNGGGSFPNNDKHASTADWLALADSYWEASVASSSGIPLIWGTDAVHGHNNVIGATLFPHNIGLGAANDETLVRSIGEITAVEVAATGIDWVFAPTVAIVKDDRWGRTYEGYSDRSDIVSRYAGQIVEGIQDQSLPATAKHFIGDGGTYQGIDQGDTRLSLQQLLDIHGAGYTAAIDAGVYTVMASFNRWNGEKIHGNKILLTDVLKEQMGFKGFVISDWNGIGQVKGCTDDNCPQAINAGIDMVMVPEDWKSFYNNMLAQVKSGVIPESRIDDAVRRILWVKAKTGLLDKPKPSARALAQNPSIIGSKAHRQVALDAVRKSLVLLKNNDGLLPLKPDMDVLVAGRAADDIGMQNGGWTISWQGTGNSNSDFPGATSIFDGIKNTVEASGGSAVLNVDGEYTHKPDVAIVVFGETPYAEGVGDILSLAWQQKDAEDYRLLQKLKAQDITVVSVFVTGRPRWVNREINQSDAFVVAWLPGSEGKGIADVLFSNTEGKPVFDFTGRLSFDWPNRDLNADDSALPVADILFPYGYGLSYSTANANLAALDETPLGFVETLDIEVFNRGNRKPWQLYVGDDGNWGTSVDTNLVTSANARVSVKSVDYLLQEDARQITWLTNENEAQPAIVFWQSEKPVDLSPLVAANGLLTLRLKLDSAPPESVSVRMDCGWPCSASVDLTTYLQNLAVGEWQELSIPLSCFVNAGLDVEIVNTPLVIEAQGPFTMTLSRAALLASKSTDNIVDCDG